MSVSAAGPESRAVMPSAGASMLSELNSTCGGGSACVRACCRACAEPPLRTSVPQHVNTTNREMLRTTGSTIAAASRPPYFWDSKGNRGREEERVSHREGRLELRVPLDCLLHRKVVQLVCEHDTPDRIEVAIGQVADEQVVVIVDVGSGDVALPGAPVERVVLPHDR